ncbi:MAG: GNAT family N-acetyltransferase [Gemmatimonadota bacterium]
MDVVSIKPEQADAAANLLARALNRDASSAYHFPDESTRLRRLEWLHGWLLRLGIRSGAVYATSPELAGVAIWMPPGSERVSLGEKIAAGLLGAPAAIGIGGTRRLLASRKALERVRARSLPGKHWYLVLIGVDPQHQGRGVGSSLMRHVLDRADDDGLPCYLETANKASRKTFQQFGFEVIGEAVGPRGLPAWAMVRPPAVREPSAP